MKANYNDIKSKYILKTIFENLTRRKFLDVIHYNKDIKKKVEISLNDYILFSQIEIELRLKQSLIDKYEKNKFMFINYNNENEKYIHIYFNGDKQKEIKINYINKTDNNISKINIVIDYKMTSLKNLFKDCVCLKEISFLRFNRKNITDISFMFQNCLFLEIISFSQFQTENVKKMNNMFYGCPLLEEINLDNFDTNKVEDVSFLFYDCGKLK